MADAAELKAKGNAALAEGKFDEAIGHYTAAIEVDSTNHVFYSNRSAAYLSKGDAENALKDADQCIKTKPDWAKGYNRKGAALHRLGRGEDALETYEAGLKVDPENAAIKSAMEALRSDMGPFGQSMWARLATDPKFQTYLQDPTYVQMLRTIQQDQSKLSAFQHDPRIIETLGFLLGIPMSAGAGGMGGPGGAGAAPAEPPKAPEPEPEPEPELTEEEKADKEKHDAANKIKQEGNDLYKAKDFEGALAKYDEAIAAYGTDITYMLNKGSVYFGMKDYENCIKVCKDAIERGRELMVDYKLIAKAFARIGNAYQKTGEYDKAIESYQSSLLEHHDDAVYKKIKTVELTRKKKAAEAYFDEEKAEQAKQRGNELFKEGKFRDAIDEYSDAIKRNPKNAVFYCNRATARTKIMDWIAALNDCDKAIELDATYVKAYARKGNIQTFTKEYHKAIETFQKGLNVDPDNEECKMGLNNVVAKVNMTSGAADKERAARAMSDPEIQAILADPMVSQALRDMQRSPEYATKAMNDPSMGPKIQKLIAAGVLQVGSG